MSMGEVGMELGRIRCAEACLDGLEIVDEAELINVLATLSRWADMLERTLEVE